MEKATVEMEIQYLGRVFNFHIPVEKTRDWDLDLNTLPRKAWISGKEFHHKLFLPIREEIQALLSLI